MYISKAFNFKLLQYVLGRIISFIGYCFIPSIIIAIIYKEPSLNAFIISLLTALTLGYTLMFFNRNYPKTLSKKDGRITVGLIWLITPLIGALPFIFSLEYFLNPLNAVFESFSGFTTTGSTILPDLEKIPKSILLWRAISQWIGGLGLALLIILLVNNFRNGSNYLFNAEFTSLDKEKTHPKIKETVFRVFYVYIGLSILGFLFLIAGDMNCFNALCHSFGAVSTGGFSTTNDNIGGFSFYTQSIIMILMFMSSISYVLIYWVIRGKLSKLFKDGQFKVYISIIIISSIVLFLSLYIFKDNSVSKSIFSSLFHTISAISTTGYFLPDTEGLGMFAFFIMIILMFIGGCSASSSSGLKIIRVIILVKYTLISIKRLFHPRAIIPIRYNNIALADNTANLVFGFFFLYLMIFLAGAFLYTLFGNDFISSIAMSAANISNVGPVVGNISPQTEYFSLNSASKLITITLMILGRLEIYSFLAMFSKSIWTFRG